jgi:hypothetical protein
MGRKIEMVGRQFGKWFVLSASPVRKNTNLYYLCRCQCGMQKLVPGSSLRNSQSNGCLSCRSQNTKHGLLKNGVPQSYRAWHGMIQRCTNNKSKKWHLYGKRGISVCERWLEYPNFLADMGEPPSKGMQLDRINVDGNYEPSNCRWVTPKENSANRRISLKNRHKYNIIPLNRACDYCICDLCIAKKSQTPQKNEPKI